MVKLNNQKTNWAYLLLVIILSAIVGGGILVYQFLWLPKEMKKLEIVEIQPPIKVPQIELIEMPLEETELIEIPLEELKVGENKIGNVIVTKIEPSRERKMWEEKEELIINEIDDNIKIKTQPDREIEGLATYSIYYKNKKISEEEWSPFLSEDGLRISSFQYENNKYLIITHTTRGSGGVWDIHDFYIFSNNNLKRLFSFEESFGYRIIGYKNFIFIESASGGKAGLCYLAGIQNFYILNGDKAEIKSFDAVCPSWYCGCFLVCDCFYFPNKIFLIEKGGKLYIKRSNGYVYVILPNKEDKEECELENNCSPLGYIGVDEYYLIENGSLVKANQEFKTKYYQKALFYQEILQKEDWEKLRLTEEERAKEKTMKYDWLSSLLGRTLNLIFAGEEEKAWKGFFEDFTKFSQKYPSEEIKKIDPNKIKEEIEKQLKESM